MKHWIRASNPTDNLKSVFVAHIHTSALRGITWRSQQSKNLRFFGIEPFWKKPTLKPPVRWDRWQIMLKLAILAKEGISIDTLCDDPPDKVSFPPEPIYVNNVENGTDQSEKDRKTPKRST